MCIELGGSASANVDGGSRSAHDLNHTADALRHPPRQASHPAHRVARRRSAMVSSFLDPARSRHSARHAAARYPTLHPPHPRRTTPVNDTGRLRTALGGRSPAGYSRAGLSAILNQCAVSPVAIHPTIRCRPSTP